MNLPESDTPLYTYAEEQNMTSLIHNFIDKGGMDFMLNAWIAYAAKELRDRSLLDDMTPVSGLDLGRRIFEDIVLDFREQAEKKEQ